VAANLIEIAKSYLTPELVHRIGGELGESPEHVEKAINAGIPSILAGFLNMATKPAANRPLEMLKHEPAELAHLGGLDGIFGNLGSLVGGGSFEKLTAYGRSLLSSLFGGKLESIVDLITKSSGMKASSASSLLGMLAPMLAGVLRKETVARGMSPASAADLLMSQKDAIAKLAPAGLSGALGLKSLNDLGAVADSIKSTGAEAARQVGRTASAAASQGTPRLRWIAPLALLAALIGGIYYWSTTQGPAPQNPAQPGNVATATRPASELATEKLDQAKQALNDAGKRLSQEGRELTETVSRKIALALPGNFKLDVPEKSYLRPMVQFLTSGASTREPQRFVADDVNFEGTTSDLTAESASAISNLATVLKSFGNVKLKIEGRADRDGDPAQNKQIALEQATAVKDALVKAGVPADRLMVEAVGPGQEVASNSAEVGRAKFRRIALVIVSS
jgi:outer membrane protein OmpA-like peptidoglycan-associated protein